MNRGFRFFSAAGILVAVGCTPIAAILLSRFSLKCAFGSCGCVRVVTRVYAPSISDPQSFKDLGAFFPASNLNAYRVEDPVLSLDGLGYYNRTLPFVFLYNRYNDYLTRLVNGVQKKANNYLGFSSTTAMLLPPDEAFAVYEADQIGFALVKPSGGVHLEVQRPTDANPVVAIDSPNGTVGGLDALTLTCSNSQYDFYPSRSQPTLVRYRMNISSRSEVEATTLGAFGGVDLKIFWRNDGREAQRQDLCGREVVPDAASTAPGTGYLTPRPNQITAADLTAAGFYSLPSFVHQPHPDDVAQFGLHYCGPNE